MRQLWGPNNFAKPRILLKVELVKAETVEKSVMIWTPSFLLEPVICVTQNQGRSCEVVSGPNGSFVGHEVVMINQQERHKNSSQIRPFA